MRAPPQSTAFSRPFAAAKIPFSPRSRCKRRLLALHLLISLQHACETRVQGAGDLRPSLETRENDRGRLDGGEAVAARLAAKRAVARGSRGSENHALAFQHPGIAPPQRLGLAPGAVEHHHAFELAEEGALVLRNLALAVERNDLALHVEVGGARRAEIEHSPVRGILDRVPERLGQA